MTRLTRIGPGSAFKVGCATYALLAGVVGLLVLLFGILGMGAASDLLDLGGFGAGIVGMLIGYIINVIIFGAVGGIGAIITAVIYNAVVGWTGGLEIDLS